MISVLAIAALAAGPHYDRNGNGRGAYEPPPDTVPGTLTWDFYPGDTSRPPSVERLDQRPTIDTKAPAATFLYQGNDAGASAWAPWGLGDGLNIAGSSTVPTTGSADPLLGSVDVSVLFNAGKCYQATASTSGDLTTEDIRLAWFGQFSGTNGQVLLEKRAAAGSGAGYTLDVSGGALRFTASDGTDSASISTAALTAGAWYFVEFFVDKSGSGMAFVNGAGSGSAASFAAVDSLTNSGKLTLGGDAAAANAYGARIAFVGLWARASWFVDHIQTAAAVTQFARLTATLARCIGGLCYPLTNTHDIGYLKKYDGSSATTMFLMGAGWPRVEKNSATQGMINERAPSNLALQSEDLTTTWTELVAGDTETTNVGAVSWPALVGAAASTTGDALVMNATNTNHGFSQTVAIPDNQDWSWSVFFKAGDHTWVYLAESADSCSAYFDLTACAACVADGYTNCPAAVGTVTNLGTSPKMAYAKNYGNGICRVDIQPQGNSAHNTTVSWQVADADGDKTVIGDAATVSVYAWGAQVSPAADWADNYVATTTATVAKNSGSLVYLARDLINATGFSMVCSIHRPAQGDDVGNYEGIMALSAGRATANSATLGIDEGINAWNVRAAGVTVADITDNVSAAGVPGATTYGVTASANSFGLYSSGTAIGTDSSGAMPSGLDTIAIGVHADAGHYFAGIVERCRLYNVAGRIQ